MEEAAGEAGRKGSGLRDGRTRRRNWVLCQCSPAASSDHPLPLDSSGANLQDGVERG